MYYEPLASGRGGKLHFCKFETAKIRDCIQFITGLKIKKVFADFATIHKNRMRPKKEVETYSGKMLKAAGEHWARITKTRSTHWLFK